MRSSSRSTRRTTTIPRAFLAVLLVLVPVLSSCTDETPEDSPEATSTASDSAVNAYEPFGAPCAGVPADYGSTVDLSAGAAIAAEPLLSNLDGSRR